MTFEKLAFQATWREYQERILEELDSHLDDDHLHVVAAPGSGKTILGLEVMRRIGKPSVILAPSLTIRNQWIDRLTSMFMVDGEPAPKWISKDIRKPKFLTVITYQALHAAFAGEEEIEDEDIIEAEEELEEGKAKKKKSEAADIITFLKKQRVRTIVLDEAHHLRKEWWKALTRLKDGLEKPIIVSLTATPPYDVEYKEWQKYEELCGPIDTEIVVPELVKHGDLCPHQDYVYFSLPAEKEAEKLRQFKGDIAGFLETLKVNQRFFDILSTHPWVNDTENHVEAILNEPKFFSSIIIFLNSAGIKTPKYALKILGVNRSVIPILSPNWLEEILTGVLYTHVEHFAEHDDVLDEMRKELKRIGAIERRKVTIANTKEIQKMLAGSLGKLDSIVDIARTEVGHLGDDLRMVVLADFIRKTAMPERVSDLRPMDKVGVVPIFEYIRRANISGTKLGILTGSLIIVPKDAKPLLESVAKYMGLNKSHIRYGKVVHDENYIRVDIKGEQRQRIVYLITEVFNAGGITVLVGTQALLGEGWDAPTVNTLVLASYVGSYMLSNQMRGRAIRIDPKKPNKASNIWHLVAVDIETLEEKMHYYFTGKTEREKHFSPFDEIKEDLGHDIKTLRRRFRAFEGLSFTKPAIIETGFKRLSLAQAKWTKSGVGDLNKLMLKRAEQRECLAKLWEEGLQGSSPKPEMHEKVESNYVPRGIIFADTLKYMAINALITGAAWGSQFMGGGRGGNVKYGLLNVKYGLLIGLGIAAFVAVPKLLKTLYLAVRHGSLEGSMKQVGWAILETLQHMDLIKTNPKNLRIETAKDKVGIVYCRLDGATTIERRHFNEAMQEALGSTESPRYVLVRSSYLGTMLRVDYHPVPSVIGQKKNSAEFYAKRWNRYVGKAQLVYTRSVEGRMILLRARTKSLASSFKKKTDRRSVWE